MWSMKSLCVLVIVTVAIFGFFWFANFLGSGEKAQSEKPLVICQPQNAPLEQQKCFWTAHIHATVKIFKRGQEVSVSFEEGELEGQHTHSEPNKLHWHGLIPVDPQTKVVSDWSSLEVGKISKDFKLPMEDAPKFTVNGKEVDPFYVWQDGDIIEIRYEW